MLTVITPCSRPENLPFLYQSLDFTKVTHWYIVYDTSDNRTYSKLFENYKQITELFIDGSCAQSKVGNFQRNYAMSLVKQGYVYFLDDDNLIHPDLFSSIDFSIPNKIYTFSRFYEFVFGTDNTVNAKLIPGKKPEVKQIDMAQVCFDIKIKPDYLFFDNTLYEADGVFIVALCNLQPEHHVYVNKTLSFYNALNPYKLKNYSQAEPQYRELIFKSLTGMIDYLIKKQS